MPKNDFNEKVNRFMTKIAPDKIEASIRKIVMACYQRIQEISPVDEGTFRANWMVAFGTIKREFDDTLELKDVAQKTSDAMVIIAKQQELLGETIFICNSAPYATILESGYSQQASAGVVGPVVRVIKAAIKAGRL